jgi:putative colanic acid biosynthesis glycosyltransferase
VILPKVTIITVNYNMVEDLARTIASVSDQSYDGLEYIVVDGGSSDGSTALLESQAGGIARWVSEPDRGLYDAMNKGVRIASGDWVLFMNAGDTFHNRNVVADVFSRPADDADIIYGHMMRHYAGQNVQRLVRSRPVSALPLSMPCSHQSLFARRTLLLQIPFADDLSIVADHDFLLRAQRVGARFRQIDRIIGNFATGGTSDRNRRESMRQLRHILQRHGLMTPVRRACLAVKLARALAGNWLKNAMPEPLVRWILRHRLLS